MRNLERLPETLALLLALAVILIITYKAIVYYAENCPVMDPLTGQIEDQQEIAAQHVDKRTSGHSAAILADMTGLRRDLPPARNMTGSAQARYLISRYAGETESEGGLL